MKKGFLAFSLILLSFASHVHSETLTAEGVQGEVDKERRGPVLSIEPIRESGQVRILADAFTNFKDYSGYPLKFEFYINRELKATQIRSKELPGPVGITVPSSMATIPFNYSVVATLLTPNRNFTSYIAGAIYDKTLSLTAPCSATFKKSDGTSLTYTHSSSEFKQSGQNSLSFDMELIGSPSYNELDISGDITLDTANNTATSSITTSIDGKVESHESIGNFTEAESGTLNSIALTSTDGRLKLSCK